mmetsp:Transcript_24232/g.59757  ORF Transcript_24232/g.59757 Transcript_24232/m.59757 type:complete len:80 (-) Transcript_24232:300-539(-)
MLAAIGCDGLCALEAYSGSANLDTLMHFATEHLLRDCGNWGLMNLFQTGVSPTFMTIGSRASLRFLTVWKRSTRMRAVT